MLLLDRRKREWETAKHCLFDVAIIGGGINGASLYHQLCSKGYRVLLVDRGDFGGGTSQASAMMIWGGLLYLRNLDVVSVLKLSLCRDHLIGRMKDWVRPQKFRFVARHEARNTALVESALHLYWMMSGFRRERPCSHSDFSERSFLAGGLFDKALDYQEARVIPSDARFVLQWILRDRSDEQIALNHCGVFGGGLDRAAGPWHLQLRDSLLQEEAVARARLVVNAAGVWTDRVNHMFGINSLYKHVFSKGIFIGLKRDSRHKLPLILDTGSQGDCMSYIPWGPISLWGPTETPVQAPEDGFRATSEDIAELLSELNGNLATPAVAEDIVSIRCGVRPLAVEQSYTRDCYPLDLSRRSRIDYNRSLSWISIFGGKLTDCIPLAQSVARLLRGTFPPSIARSVDEAEATEHGPGDPELQSFPGLEEEVPSAAWCAKNEACWTLEDYLRRRTNIAQWIPRGGLGRHGENVPHMRTLCRVFCDNDEEKARDMLQRYQQKIQSEFDPFMNPLGNARLFPAKKEEAYVV